MITFLEKIYRYFLLFFYSLAATSLLPALYLVKSSYRVLSISDFYDPWINAAVYLLVPIILSLLSLWIMQHMAADSISNPAKSISPVNNDYLPIYLGYIFVSLSMPNPEHGSVDWTILIIVYILICSFVTFSQSLCFNPMFIIFGYGYYSVKTENNVRVFVITRNNIGKSSMNVIFPNLAKITEIVYIEC